VVVAGAASGGATAWLRRHPAALDVLDRPGARKPHRDPVPAIGGIGLVLGIVLAWGLGGMAQPAVLPAALLALLAAGLVDDHRGLSARARFALQAAVVLLLALGGGMVLRDFGALLAPGIPLATGMLALPLTVFCAVGLINATNMIDGSDGLAGSLALASLAGIATLLALAGDVADLLPLLGAAAAALVAFLAFNLRVGGRPARVFLGNGGSMALGALLAWLAITLSQGPDRAFAPATALWLFAVPLVDTVSVMWRRLAARASPFDADHQHVHHLLLRAGFGVNPTLSLLLALHAGCVLAGVAMEWAGVDERLRAGGFVLLALLLHGAKVRASRRLPPLAGNALH
jgi:undecaprenyl-phosphate alpha-N-acetylglucosaminyl 1-phosphatetransferase